MFVENLNARKATRVGMVNSFHLNGMETEAFHQLNHPHYYAAQNQQYKIILHARHKLRARLIRSRTIKQPHPFDLYLICKRSALGHHVFQTS